MGQSLELAFVQDNARNESATQIIDNFIPTDVFWKLFCPRHQVIFGSRGSGKTALSKMASYPFLSDYKHHDAEKILDECKYVGVFVNTDIRFVGSLRNKIWNDDSIAERYFVWKFNVNCMKAFLVTLDAILSRKYGDASDRYLIERDISNAIAKRLLGKILNIRLIELVDHLSDYEYIIREEITSSFINSENVPNQFTDAFSTDIFEPIQFAIRVAEKHLEINSDANWLFFVDEAEFLTKAHHRILNSFMRANTGKIFVKLATLTYFHHTLETNLNVHLQPNDDFEYLYIDASPIYELNSKATHIYKFARDLYYKRIENFVRDLGGDISDHDFEVLSNLDRVLGGSPLEKHKPLPKNIEEAIGLISNYVDEKTLNRAHSLKTSRKRFGNEIWRKLIGIIYLIEDKRQAMGNKQLSCYSGVETAIRCTDGVPRRMINLFQEITKEAFIAKRKRPLRRSPYYNHKRAVLSMKAQSRILKNYSTRRHNQIVAVPAVGPDLIKLVDIIGFEASSLIHDSAISTDITGSFRLDRQTIQAYEKLIRNGVAFGYMFPNVMAPEPELIFDPKSSYRLSFALSPYFSTFPRRGKAVSLSSLIRSSIKKPMYLSRKNKKNMILQRSPDLFEGTE